MAFTSVGKGDENEHMIFFTKELAPTKPPEDVGSKQLNLTSLNITWKALTLFEARGFPEYSVVLTPIGVNSRRKRQSSSIQMVTNNSHAVFAGLRRDTDYSVVVGVRTGNSSEFLEGDPVNGMYVIIWSYK